VCVIVLVFVREKKKRKRERERMMVSLSLELEHRAWAFDGREGRRYVKNDGKNELEQLDGVNALFTRCEHQRALHRLQEQRDIER
jgi:hypothetical protein